MKRSTSWIAVLPSLVIPICIGMTMYMGLVISIQQGLFTNELMLRYITGHPVSKVTVGMFFIGISSLALIAKNVFEQFGAERKVVLRTGVEEPVADSGEEERASCEAPPTCETVSDKARTMEDRLLELPSWMHDHYLWQRIGNALHHLRRTNSATGVEEELKYLAELDLDRQQQRYSLVQILIWATPMLGFLGTVLGISQALGGINVGPDNNFQQMMDGLRGSLYVAFDTTALALTLSMIMMFGQFLIERFESQLLELVDQRSRAEISGQFDMSVSESSDRVDRISAEIWEASRDLVKKQTEIWRKSIESAELAWVASLTDANAQVQTNLTDALEENVSNLAHYLGESIEKADTAMAQRWEQWQVTLSDNARLMSDHQQQVAEQTRTILQLAKQAENQEAFHTAIEENRTALEATKELRETLDTLAKAISGMTDSSEAELVATPSMPISAAGEIVGERMSPGDVESAYVAEVILPFRPLSPDAESQDKKQLRNRTSRHSSNKAA